ncbi:hypothetical protein P6709_20185, partial [Jeotgalibacillus sp. ET6]|nr:hypothetical protein [Jeotgalibacillus sp. ET6]
MLFIAAAFFGPLVSAVSGVAVITAPSLIIVGSLMMGTIVGLEHHLHEQQMNDYSRTEEIFMRFLKTFRISFLP